MAVQILDLVQPTAWLRIPLIRLRFIGLTHPTTRSSLSSARMLRLTGRCCNVSRPSSLNYVWRPTDGLAPSKFRHDSCRSKKIASHLASNGTRMFSQNVDQNIRGKSVSFKANNCRRFTTSAQRRFFGICSFLHSM